MVDPRAGEPAPQDVLVDVDRLLADYADVHPDPSSPAQRVAFGTSGHRGTSSDGSFNDDHVAAIAQAIADHRRGARIRGPLFLGKDTHALSRPAERTALEVFTANEVWTIRQVDDGFAPTPVISHEILVWNRDHGEDPSDGVVVTPSHNPPCDGGFKYNPPHGGPAGSRVTKDIQDRANAYLASGLEGVRRLPFERAAAAARSQERDFVSSYVPDLARAIDLGAIRDAGVRIGIDPLGGSALPYVAALAEAHGLDVTVVNDRLDPRFAFMTLDHDGKIRMDCSSPYAMAPLIAMKDRFDVAFGTDPDADRHGIVAPSAGLLDPNRYLAVAIRYLLRTRLSWSHEARIGKTLVTSSLLDRVAKVERRGIYEVPVGFKWFAEELAAARIVFGGEESAGASFLSRDGHPWTTDKDGILLGLLAAEMRARTGRDPGQLFEEIAEELGRPFYRRRDVFASAEVRERLAALAPDDVPSPTLAGDPVVERRTTAAGNGARIGGIKVSTSNGWLAVRPSGTEPIAKIYAESFVSESHLEALLDAGAALTGEGEGEPGAPA